MTFHWRVSHSEPRAALDLPAVEGAGFSTQGDAETHLGENWRQWFAAGVTAVTLMDGATSVYDMSLEL